MASHTDPRDSRLPAAGSDGGPGHDGEGNLIEALQALQARHGWLREEDLRALSRRRRVPLHEIQGVASFYPHFRRQPPARHHVRVCRDAACWLAGGDEAAAQLRDAARAQPDVEVKEVSCLGRCDRAPACSVDEVPLSLESACRVLAGESASAAPPRPARRWQLDPHAGAGAHYSVLREWLSGGERAVRRRELTERLQASGLRGMGGAGFPTGRKWQLVAAERATPRYVVCNADESEPGTFKDREVLAQLPHLVLEGMALGGLAVGSHEAWIYVRHEYGPETERVRAEIERARALGALGKDLFGSGFDFDVRLFVSPGGYILGEETALLEALEGRRGEPRNKPPFPGQRGLFGRPTLVNNVESFAQVPRALRTGRADWKLYAVSGDVVAPQVVEAPLGTSARELIARCGGLRDGAALQAFLPGGASTGFLPASQQDLPLEWDALTEAGSALGSAAVLVVAEGRSLRALARNLTAFFRNESCGKCVPCRLGTEKAVQLIDAGDPASLALLPELATTLADTSICGLGHAALIPIRSVLDRFATKGGSG